MLLGAFVLLLGSRQVVADTLKDIHHVVIFMQENRAFNNVCLHLSPCKTGQ